MNDEALVTLRGLSRALKLPTGWILERARRGEIPHLRVGRKYRFSVTAVKRAVIDLASKSEQESEIIDGSARTSPH